MKINSVKIISMDIIISKVVSYKEFLNKLNEVSKQTNAFKQKHSKILFNFQILSRF